MRSGPSARPPPISAADALALLGGLRHCRVSVASNRGHRRLCARRLPTALQQTEETMKIRVLGFYPAAALGCGAYLLTHGQEGCGLILWFVGILVGLAEYIFQ